MQRMAIQPSRCSANMIFGIGTDIVRIQRIEEDLIRFGDRFAERILTDGELREFRLEAKKANYLARRFAAKEAAAKAMGTGFSNGLTWRDIEVTHNPQGRPLLKFHGQARRFADEQHIVVAHLSLADEHDHAVAFVTLETEP